MPSISWVLHARWTSRQLFMATQRLWKRLLRSGAWSLFSSLLERRILAAFGEATVKSAKGLLLKAMGNARLRQDEVATVLVEVEAVLNSRPMMAPSSNPNDGEVLTSGHFLIGGTLAPLQLVSTEPVDDAKLTLLKRWQLISNIKRRFWIDCSASSSGQNGRRRGRTYRSEQSCSWETTTLLHNSGC
ncbi:uncharacterized protein LOC116803947 [Drosophila mojavensis]|uniref:uncharacterized protein LOC116803947 n=1 Tax=Drosophila mojavensis TaxID=7230 RepID=UPI0013EEDA3B|nr:uncharacterized protein LOC116803947 [Drosophila mojavensis]XP_043864575.1 uncharacterized protein LOC116803947 [Drosophila mojavensis]